jgi:hypothetical protein
MSEQRSEALALDEDGRPTLYTALNLHMMLDVVSPEMEPALEAASALITEWYGDQYRWANASFDPEGVRYRPALLDYVSGYAAAIPTAVSPFDDLTAPFLSHGRNDFLVHLTGGDEEGASPFAYRFFAEVPDDSKRPMEAHAYLSLSVPVEHDNDLFAERALQLASILRPRWANVGLGYARWNSGGAEVEEAVYEHCRRFLGFDGGFSVRHTNDLLMRVRSVSWVTILGPALAAELATAPSGDLDVSSVDGLHVIKAGPRPESCDKKRKAMSRAYRSADEYIRPIRAARLAANRTPGPWTNATLEKWLRRFERTDH